jgi:K+-transporting ATPase ATPase C chain
MNEIVRAIRITIVLWVLVAVIYPAGMLAIAQLPFLSYQANGSLIRNAQGQIVGSALIGQPFTSDKYFNSRPSTTNYSTADPKKDDAGILKTGVSGASNLAPSNPALLDRIKGKSDPDPSKAIVGDIPRLQTAGVQPTADLIYTSGYLQGREYNDLMPDYWHFQTIVSETIFNHLFSLKEIPLIPVLAMLYK